MKKNESVRRNNVLQLLKKINKKRALGAFIAVSVTLITCTGENCYSPIPSDESSSTLVLLSNDEENRNHDNYENLENFECNLMVYKVIQELHDGITTTTTPITTTTRETTTTTSTTTSTTTTESTTTTATTTELTTVTEPIQEEIVETEPIEIIEEISEVIEETSIPAESTASSSISSYDYIMICNVVAVEYGAEYISIPEKAKVVEVIMNRVNSTSYPNTVYDVLTQPYQFSGINSYLTGDHYNSNVSESVIAAVDYYFDNPGEFQHGYLSFSGDGTWNYFR